MISKKAVTVVLLIVLFYLLFIKNVEGMETSGDNEGGFFIFQTCFGGMLNLFFDDEGEDENEKCKLNKTIINEIYEFNIDDLDFDLTELIITIFNESFK